ncbi:hypothetical protein INT48_004765 [Thamnidium elegans]|uniref:Uncharacterized protein n=1 Tax=Thamnidium elegans TaxID=101142 RepID=A0A8H7VP85_9FUNG|nr:hypothetical protein INT48_004765 [Thamnidium elegans]
MIIFQKLKGGESINPNPTFNKQELYDGAEKVAGFKVDFRIILDADNNEYDVGAGEAARDNANTKLHHDLGKLLREGKDVLDCLLLNTSDAVEV